MVNYHELSYQEALRLQTEQNKWWKFGRVYE
jgi:hypothetical protein